MERPAISQDFEKTGTDTATQTTPGEMPAVLRPSVGERHPIGHPGSAPGVAPVGRTPGDGPLDPRTSYGTNMPTYDESISSLPTPGTNDFG